MLRRPLAAIALVACVACDDSVQVPEVEVELTRAQAAVDRLTVHFEDPELPERNQSVEASRKGSSWIANATNFVGTGSWRLRAEAFDVDRRLIQSAEGEGIIQVRVGLNRLALELGCDAIDCGNLEAPCQRAECSEDTGACEAAPLADDTLCDDGDPCTSGERCSAGRCGDGVCTGDAACECTMSDRCIDADGDGHPADSAGCLEDRPDAIVDCDDGDRMRSPTAVERCNGEDDNCDGVPDRGLGALALGPGGALRSTSAVGSYAFGREPFTVELALRLRDFEGAAQLVGFTTEAGNGWSLRLLEGGELQLAMINDDGVAGTTRSTGRVARDGEWVHVAAVRSMDPQEIRYFIDGEPAGVGRPGSEFERAGLSGAAPLTIGDPEAALRADFDELRIWSAARAEAALADDRCRDVHDDAPGLLSRWSFEDDAEDTAITRLEVEALGAVSLRSVTTTGAPDEDGDGFVAFEECDDFDAEIFPGAIESCDGVDEDCDGVVDRGDQALALGAEDALCTPLSNGAFALGAQDFTLELAVRVEAAADLLRFDDSGGSGFSLRVDRDLRLGFDATTRALDALAGNSTVALEADAWSHVAVVVDNAARELRFFVEGALAGSEVIPLPFAEHGVTGRNRLCIGGDGAVEVDELRIWVEALDEAQLRRGQCDPADASDEALLSYWPFETSIADLGSNALALRSEGDSVALVSLASGESTDADADGFPAGRDCDDSDRDVNPAAVERCNDRDDDCDGIVDRGPRALELEDGDRMASGGAVEAYAFGEGDFSIEMAVRIDSLADAREILRFGERNPNWVVGIAGENLRVRAVSPAGASWSIVSAAPLEAGVWTHVAIVGRFDGPTVDIYLDGRRDITELVTAPWPMGAITVGQRFGIGGITQSHFEGAIDELRIWNYARSEDEVRDGSCRRLKASEPGLVGWWPFEPVLGDLSPSAVLLQSTGTPATIDLR